MAERKTMDLGEFKNEGFLQEANRLFFHPLGLALELTTKRDGSHQLSAVWDYRDDPEGVVFDQLDATKAERVAEERSRHVAARVEMMGSPIQPLDYVPAARADAP